MLPSAPPPSAEMQADTVCAAFSSIQFYSSSPHTFCHLPNVDRQIAGIGNLMDSFFFSPEELSHSDGADPFKAYNLVLYHFLFY